MIKTLLLILGVILLAIGIIGFFNDPVFGLFDVDTVHNFVHIITGGLALLVSGNAKQSRMYGRVMAVVYGLVTVIGFFSVGEIFGVMDINTADNILHLVLTLIFLYIGFGP